jgi:RNA polymerase sigma factor (sigma-70 family)
MMGRVAGFAPGELVLLGLIGGCFSTRSMEVDDITPDQRRLFERFAGGDDDAYEAVFRQFQHEVYGWILRLVRDSGVAEDLTLETFWRIYRSRARFDPQRSFGAWARKIATNVAISYLKRQKPYTDLPLNLAVPARDSLAQRELAQRIEAAFRSLSARLQVVARMALIEEQPYEEIADALGLSVGAIKSRIFRAVRLLKQQLSDRGEHI